MGQEGRNCFECWNWGKNESWGLEAWGSRGAAAAGVLKPCLTVAPIARTSIASRGLGSKRAESWFMITVAAAFVIIYICPEEKKPWLAILSSSGEKWGDWWYFILRSSNTSKNISPGPFLGVPCYDGGICSSHSRNINFTHYHTSGLFVYINTMAFQNYTKRGKRISKSPQVLNNPQRQLAL